MSAISDGFRFLEREVIKVVMESFCTLSTVPYRANWYFWFKRYSDRLLALLLLVGVLPFWMLIALLIKLDSPGPVLFVQTRAGSRLHRHNNQTYWELRPFRIYKFRSMYCNADQALHKRHIHDYVQGHLHPTQTEHSYKLQSDPRVTRVGRLLRRMSIDEIPQLLNVLFGDMSLVGPRPVPLYEFEEYEDQHKQRLAALPGITGLWQVKGRCVVSFEEQIQMDLDYISNQSLLLDLKILALTVPAALSGRGAG